MRIARVFATKTKMCPNDKDSYFNVPDLFTPIYDEIHISVTFTWAIKRGYELMESWRSKSMFVKIGGPAFDDSGNGFSPGTYLREGIIITSRGCPKNCSWCFVPKREGKIRELKIFEGNIIQDNNLLACSKGHIDRVFQMLSKQKRIDFAGGLDIDFMTDEIIERLRNLNIHQLWIAYDEPNKLRQIKKIVSKLSRYFTRDKIRCYVLIGYNGDTLEKAEERLKTAYKTGTLPFAMRYRNDTGVLFKERDWNLLTWQWSRPAIIKSIMRSDK